MTERKKQFQKWFKSLTDSFIKKEDGMCKECDEVMWHSTQFHPNER